MGTVYLVGAGPGDPKLITRRGAELLRRADVVLHDALVGPEVMALVRPAAELIDVGRRSRETRWLDQDRINHMLVELAAEHEVVVRLKGGDPLVFGRGGEEALVLAEAGVPFEIIPGITAGIGALAYAGIPLTHRGVATTALFITAVHDEDAAADERWRHIAHVGGTLVVYMGGARIRAVTERLVRLGRSPETPAAMVESGTLPAQRVVHGTLATLADRIGAAAEGVHGPQLIVVGEVARLAEPLEWVKRGPLAGRAILLARGRAQRSHIAATLRGLGATVHEFPTVRGRPGGDVERLAPALAALGGAGAIVFTGAAAVRAALAALRRAGRDARALAGPTLVGIGRETVAALRRGGLRADLRLRSYQPARVAAALERRLGALAGAHVLMLRDGQDGSGLAQGLAAAGARVLTLDLVERVLDGRGRQPLERVIAGGGLDAVVLPSSSAVEALAAVGPALPADIHVIAIGAATAETAARLGLPAAQVASGGEAGIVDALLARFGGDAGSRRGPPRGSAASDS